MKYYEKKLEDFETGDPVLLFGDTVYVVRKKASFDTVTLELSGGFNHSGIKGSTLTTYGKKKRSRRSKQEVELNRKLLQQGSQEAQQFENQYSLFLRSLDIVDQIDNFKVVQASQIKVGDIIKRSKKHKCEEVRGIEDLGTEIRIVGYMGIENDERYGLDIENKDELIYLYSSK